MKKRINNPIWCILHAIYLLRYMFLGGIGIYIFVWMAYSWIAGINGTY